MDTSGADRHTVHTVHTIVDRPKLAEGGSAAATRRCETPAPAWLWLTIGLLVAAAGAARLARDPWMAHQAPAYARLLEGHLVVRDLGVAQHYGVVSMVAEVAPPAGKLWWISNDHYRGWLPLYAAGVLYYWTGQMFWSIAAVDLLAWWLSALCTFRLAQRLDVSYPGSVAAAFLCATSPAFANSAWMSLLHLANTGSLVFGTYAALRILDGEFGGDRGRFAGGLALGLVLFGTSLLYSYVWVIVPCLVAVSAVEGSNGRRFARVRTWVLALVTFGALTYATQLVLAAIGWPLFVQSNDAAVRLRQLWGEVANSAAPLAAALRLAGALLHPAYMATVFHPLVLGAGVLGMALGSRRLRVAGAVATALAIIQGSMTGLPWVVVNNYPFVYAGAGVAIGWAYRWTCQRTLSWSAAWLRPASRRSLAAAAMALIVGTLMTGALMAVTNLDLIGNYRYVRSAWSWLGLPI